jgi:hypothetical protein
MRRTKEDLPAMKSTPVSPMAEAAIKRALEKYNLPPDRFALALAYALEVAGKDRGPGNLPISDRCAEIAIRALDTGFLDSRASNVHEDCL